MIAESTLWKRYTSFLAIKRQMCLGLVFLFAPLLSSCQNAAFIRSNPLFLDYLLYKPTIDFSTSGTAILKRIDYRNIDKGIVDYGDDIIPSERRQLWEFDSSRLVRISVEIRNKLGVFVEPSISVSYTNGKIIVTNFTDRSTQVVDEYTETGGAIASAAKGGSGKLVGYIDMDSQQYRYWNSARSHENRPSGPDILCEFNGKEVQITVFRANRDIFWKLTYTKGILMKSEYGNDKTYTYSTDSGPGEVLVRDSNSRLIERWALERRLDSKGYLTYERVRHPDGSGYEYSIESSRTQ